jgi:hypothetical protein
LAQFLDEAAWLAFSRRLASAAIAAFIIGCILLLPQRVGRHPGETETAR